MGTIVNIAGMGMGLERQHEGMGRAWELDVRGWEQMFVEQEGVGLQLQPRAKLYGQGAQLHSERTGAGSAGSQEHQTGLCSAAVVESRQYQ